MVIHEFHNLTIPLCDSGSIVCKLKKKPEKFPIFSAPKTASCIVQLIGYKVKLLKFKF